MFLWVVMGLLVAAADRSPVSAANGAGVPAPINSDQSLALKIDAAFRDDRYLDYLGVRADSRRGTVVLTGTVLTDFEKTHAARVAGGVPGVQSVANEILVVQYAVGDESDLAERVRSRMLLDPAMKVTALSIETQSGDWIILHGIVSSPALKARIGKAASAVKGVKQVENDLSVEPDGGNSSAASSG
jgi:osmotically-inducible protein OsmY